MVLSNAARQRSELRKTIREKRHGLSASEQADAAHAVCIQALEQVDDMDAKRIAIYRTRDGELDTSELINELQKRIAGVCLYVPIVTSENRLIMVPIESSADSLASVSMEELDLIFVPLIAFDKSGNRLGFGAGHYDRFMACWRQANCSIIGLAHDIQFVDCIPCCSWDVPLPIVITPRGCMIPLQYPQPVSLLDAPYSSLSLDISSASTMSSMRDVPAGPPTSKSANFESYRPNIDKSTLRFESLGNGRHVEALDTYRDGGRAFNDRPKFIDEGGFSFGRMFGLPNDAPVQGDEVMRIDSTGFVELLRGDTTVGFAAVAMEANGTPRVNSLFMLPTSQERGHGRELFQKAVQWLKAELPESSPINISE